MSTGAHCIGLGDIRAAAERVAPHVRRTPAVESAALSELAGRMVIAKCETMQRTGSFKIRGATSAVQALGEAEARRGVVTHSSGNHALALATAAGARGIPAHVVMPVDASDVKRRAVIAAGATVHGCGPTAAERAAMCDAVARETGATIIPPYDHPHVIAGQGTVGLEIAEQVPEAATVVVPVGGGGLIGGIAVALRALRPGIRIVGAEPALADDAAESRRTGRIAPQRPPVSIADGLRAPLGVLTFPLVRDLVDDLGVVDERAIVDAMRVAFDRAALVIEPSAAVGLAALATGKCGGDESRPTVVVLCGANVDLSRLPWIASTR
ncbi:MAG: pyridoxal-phosphate dependent enzyme [Phycisphaerales bacterium]